MYRSNRFGYTLTELLISISVAGVLICLTLGVIQKSRHAALRTEAINLTKQMLIAQQHFTSQNDSYLPCFVGAPKFRGSVFDQISPYIEKLPGDNNQWTRFRSDPTPWLIPDSSYPGGDSSGNSKHYMVLSSIVWSGLTSASLSKMSLITDGLSNTIIITEKHGKCSTTFVIRTLETTLCYGGTTSLSPCNLYDKPAMYRRPSFADYPMYNEVYPITQTINGIRSTDGSQPKHFQVRPSLSDCDPTIPQSSFDGGIISGFLDGSVHFLKPSMTPSVYWSLVTPAGGESVSID